jgi:hypothetical protein
MAEDVTYNYMPADGWFMTLPSPDGNTRRVFYRVAMWRIETDGTVVGLVSVRIGRGQYNQEPVRLHAPPRAIEGQYVHWDDLTAEDKQQISEARFS